jgi:anaerobic selenocysteine-containing dehydrogenase
MTNNWNDIANSDVMLIIGANPAENHPCGFKWAIEARRLRNARMIVVDPRFTRTAATADLHVPIRAGSDIAFVGGLIRYVIENNLYAREYMLNYTNASFIVNSSIIKEVNPDNVKGSATDEINFLVFAITAFMAPVYAHRVGRGTGSAPNLTFHFQRGALFWIACCAAAIVVAFFLRETGRAAHSQSAHK